MFRKKTIYHYVAVNSQARAGPGPALCSISIFATSPCLSVFAEPQLSWSISWPDQKPPPPKTPAAKRWRPRWPPSSAATARARSCVFPIPPIRSFRSSPRGPSGWTWPWASAASRAAGSRKSSGRNPRARRPRPCTSSPRPRSAAGWRPSSTPSTPWTSTTPAASASRPRTCSSPSPTTASRPWRSPTCWSARAPWTWSWSTPWPPSSPRPNWRGTWARPRSAARPASCPTPCAS